jgi:predicted RNase H-like HicB family nuclease
MKIGGASHKIECEQEVDGRWLAEVVELPGVLTFGTTKNEANQYSAH